MDSSIIASFCGTGKTYLNKNTELNSIEFECWKYQDGNFPLNYVSKIIDSLGNYHVILISTNPVVLKELYKMGYKVVLVYPKKELKSEYMARYSNRGSNKDFIKTLYKYWGSWISELERLKIYNHYQLSSGEYLSDILCLIEAGLAIDMNKIKEKA